MSEIFERRRKQAITLQGILKGALKNQLNILPSVETIKYFLDKILSIYKESPIKNTVQNQREITKFIYDIIVDVVARNEGVTIKTTQKKKIMDDILINVVFTASGVFNSKGIPPNAVRHIVVRYLKPYLKEQTRLLLSDDYIEKKKYLIDNENKEMTPEEKKKYDDYKREIETKETYYDSKLDMIERETANIKNTVKYEQDSMVYEPINKELSEYKKKIDEFELKYGSVPKSRLIYIKNPDVEITEAENIIERVKKMSIELGDFLEQSIDEATGQFVDNFSYESIRIIYNLIKKNPNLNLTVDLIKTIMPENTVLQIRSLEEDLNEIVNNRQLYDQVKLNVFRIIEENMEKNTLLTSTGAVIGIGVSGFALQQAIKYLKTRLNIASKNKEQFKEQLDKDTKNENLADTIISEKNIEIKEPKPEEEEPKPEEEPIPEEEEPKPEEEPIPEEEEPKPEEPITEGESMSEVLTTGPPSKFMGNFEVEPLPKINGLKQYVQSTGQQPSILYGSIPVRQEVFAPIEQRKPIDTELSILRRKKIEEMLRQM